jgi:two-component system, OmpR family, copper resistance phosphate regulon response regulator CusR
MSDAYRILLVDDDKDTCEMMSLLLTLADDNYEVLSANTADEALAKMEAKPFDIFILDSLLPDMSGVELCRKVRRDDEQVPILFYSGMLDGNYISNAKAAGANEYLVKPDDLGRFTEIVKKYLSEKA